MNRLTRDLDYFAESAEAVDRCLPALEEALASAGLEVQRRQVGHGFARLVVQGESEETVIDLGADARLLPPEKTGYGLILSGEELAIDKVLAIFGRAEPRDFIDLSVLEPRYGLTRLLQQASEKDPGFQLAVFRQMLDRFPGYSETSSTWTTQATALWPSRSRAGWPWSTRRLTTRVAKIPACRSQLPSSAFARVSFESRWGHDRAKVQVRSLFGAPGLEVLPTMERSSGPCSRGCRWAGESPNASTEARPDPLGTPARLRRKRSRS